MKIKWLGHASFLITSEKGTRIITDPYKTGGNLSYGEIKEYADVVTTSHDHFDHGNVATVGGNPKIYTGPAPAEIEDVKFTAVSTFHDETKGTQRGSNMVICMDIDGIKVCHFGDLGHKLSRDEVSKIGPVDVVLLPVGGFYTIDADIATLVVNALNPKVVIPMHFKNDRCSFPVATVEGFLKNKRNIVRSNTSEIEFQKNKLPVETQTIVLKPAL